MSEVCSHFHRPEPPVTADHTPERLSEEERESLRNEIALVFTGLRGVPTARDDVVIRKIWGEGLDHADRVLGILTSHLAALSAECDVLREQVARVEALVFGQEVVGYGTQGWLSALRAALHPQGVDQERTSG